MKFKIKKGILLLISITTIFFCISCNTDPINPAEAVVEPVVFSPESGIIDAGTVVTMTSSTPGVSIWYSFEPIYAETYKNGTTASSVPVNSSCKIYAFAVSSNGIISKRATAQYTVQTCDDNNPLLFGNPSEATADVTKKTNYLLERSLFTLSYNDSTHIPNWVAWHLDSTDLGSGRYSGEFMEDELLPSGFYRVKHKDYTNSGFDRGHMCPNADRNSTDENSQATFVTTNIVAQTANNNQQVWMYLENYERDLAKQGKELYIYSGPYGKGGTNKDGTYYEYLPYHQDSTDAPSDNGVLVPAYTWKIILIINETSSIDIAKVTSDNDVIAVMVPNQKDCLSNATAKGYSNTTAWKYYLTTVDDIEEKTGYDFFTQLSKDVEKNLEAKKYSK